LITELLLQMGFDESTLTPYAHDGGIDVKGTYRAAGLTAVYAAVQVKRWKGNVQAPTVTQLRGSLDVHQQGIVITTSDFSAGARAEAVAVNKTRIGLINGEELLNLLIKHKVGVTKRELDVLDEEWWDELLGNESAPIPAAPPQPIEPIADEPDAVVAKRAASAKPESVTLFGMMYRVRAWKGVLLTVCETLAARHPETFAEVAMSVRGRKRQYVAASGEGMISPAAIGNTGLWLETNQSAESILKIVRLLLEAFGYSAEDEMVFKGADCADLQADAQGEGSVAATAGT
jgi:restriction system protein